MLPTKLKENTPCFWSLLDKAMRKRCKSKWILLYNIVRDQRRRRSLIMKKSSIILALVLVAAIWCGQIQSGTAATVDLDMSYSSKPEGLCQKGEKMIFGCTLQGGKEMSVCSSSVLNNRTGFVKFRYGTTEKIETEYPTDKTRPDKLYSFYRFARFQFEQIHLRFTVGTSKYEVFAEESVADKNTINKSGVRINTTGFAPVEYVCSGKVKGNLRRMEGLVPEAKKK